MFPTAAKDFRETCSKPSSIRVIQASNAAGGLVFPFQSASSANIIKVKSLSGVQPSGRELLSGLYLRNKIILRKLLRFIKYRKQVIGYLLSGILSNKTGNIEPTKPFNLSTLLPSYRPILFTSQCQEYTSTSPIAGKNVITVIFILLHLVNIAGNSYRQCFMNWKFKKNT